MDVELQRHARDAIKTIDIVLREGLQVEHAGIQAATNDVVAFRNRVIERFRHGAVDRAVLDRANSLVSLAYGAEFPLSGLHLHRLEQTRDGLRKLLEDG